MAFLCIRTEFINESYWISVWPSWASERSSLTSRTGFLYGLSGHPNRIRGRVVLDFCMAFLAVRKGIIKDSHWISVWPFWGSEQNSWMSRTRFLYGLSGHPNRIHGRVVLDFCMAFLGFRTEFMNESYWISVWPFWTSQQN